MSEKRFIVIEEGVEREDTVIEDTITKERYNEYGIVDVLNEQDDELHKYRTENAGLHITILENEKEIDEQQATIEQLQRICETINSLYNKINHLKEENEQLKNKLNKGL